MTRPVPKCRCCNKLVEVDHYGLCEDCAEATEQFIQLRGRNLKERGLV